MDEYKIVNPRIRGSMNTRFMAENNKEAGLNAYKEMSSYFSNNVPSFVFTLQRGNKMIHYVAKEKVNNEKVKFSVRQIDDSSKLRKIDEDALKTFIADTGDGSNVGGGFTYFDDDSSSSSSSPNYVYHRKPIEYSPITHWQYFPKIYPFQYSYVPTFISSVQPYVYVKLFDL